MSQRYYSASVVGIGVIRLPPPPAKAACRLEPWTAGESWACCGPARRARASLSDARLVISTAVADRLPWLGVPPAAVSALRIDGSKQDQTSGGAPGRRQAPESRWSSTATRPD
jgi:hypothetical protein